MPDDSACSCYLPAGCWGSGGAHMARYTEDYLRREIARLRAQGREGEAASYEPFIKSHIGLIYVYERCPAYAAACQRNKNAERARKLARELKKPEYE